MSGNDGRQDPSLKDRSFEARLHSARRRQGLDAPVPARTGTGSGLGVGLRAGMELVSAEAVAGAIGYGLDHLLHTLPLFLIIFIVLGAAAGIANVWRVMSPAPPARDGDKSI